MLETSKAKHVVAVIDDLFFMAKVKDAATAAGMSIAFARSREDAIARCVGGGCLAVVDLNAGKFAPIELVVELKAAGVTVLGFLSHVNTELRAKAVDAGADQVLARSALAQNINSIFREFAAPA
jgi:ActR/RegA family two-component response regulator